MVWSTKVNYVKKNPATVARQIDYVFNQLWGKVHNIKFLIQMMEKNAKVE